MIKGIVFDCFGVLFANDLQMRVDAVSQVNPEGGQELRDILKALDRAMISREEANEQMGKIMNVDGPTLQKAIDNSLAKNTELVAFIKTLRPTYKVALLSNVSGRKRLEQLFDPGELDMLFDTVVASGDEGIIKPEREIYGLTAERLGVSPEDCVMIDDLIEYCEGAEAVGMRAIQFKNTTQGTTNLLALIDTENQTD